MSTAGFDFASGNLSKLLAIPKYALSFVLSWFVPRVGARWVFGSAAGVGEGALAVARALSAEQSDAHITWLVADEDEAERARSEGFAAVPRRGRAGFWATLRAGHIIVTHGLGDANRFGVAGGFIVQLWHGAPIKRLHFDSPVTTAVAGSPLIRSLLRRMYRAGARQVDLYVAGSPVAAERLRTAFRVAPGKVRVLGDPRDDALARSAAAVNAGDAARSRVRALLERDGATIAESESLVLYAPTWRDGEPDPALPTDAELAALRETCARLGSHLVIRPHPLGRGAYDALLGERVHLLDSETLRDITPMLGAFDTVVTDYSSIALDFSLLGRPIIWFAPDLERYGSTRGLYEPLEVTAAGRIARDWAGVIATWESLSRPAARSALVGEARALGERFHTYRDGRSAERVLGEIRRLRTPAAELIDPEGIFFESFYGRQVSCNPLALDREIARRFPGRTRYWSVDSERRAVPSGAVPLLVGGREWFAARRHVRLLIVNDWLRYRFRRRRGQIVLQTWHGTMLKHLALGRPDVNLRTRLAVRRESRRWSLMLSQNPHATEQFRSSYAFSGEILETGYPRDDVLARALAGDSVNPVAARLARAELGVPAEARVLVYAPTWRDRGVTLVDDLDVRRLAEDLGDDWVVVARGHTRTHAFGSYASGSGRVIDASHVPDVATVLLAADVLVTDYSSIMFDAAVSRTPMLFFVPDLAAYRDRERGFTFDFERDAPGPLLDAREDVVSHARAFADEGREAAWMRRFSDPAEAWRERFAPHDDGGAAVRVVDALIERGALEGDPFASRVSF
ncbi:CDP-glycerol glycerophosphotransferase family protein [Leucobacter sp. USCH14]|uniref:CDP-glycerol glycerophosphotransferase family protein n=1 Tax=Leucobacter sp. USCH14 TaxID=3024838 RepID=UPI0030AB6119